MRNDRQIAFIGLSTLEDLALKSLLKEEWNGRFFSFQNLQEIEGLDDSFDAYIVSSSVFSCNTDFFIPKRQKIVIVNHSSHTTTKNNCPVILNPDWDESMIKEILSAFLKEISEVEQQVSELSNREIDVLKLIASGKINKEIADLLCISINTVITHRKNISSKLGIKSASGLSLYAMMNGYI